MVIGDPTQRLGRVGWCTGAAQNALGDAIAADANNYLSGEIFEQTVYLARMLSVAYLLAAITPPSATVCRRSVTIWRSNSGCDINLLIVPI